MKTILIGLLILVFTSSCSSSKDNKTKILAASYYFMLTQTQRLPTQGSPQDSPTPVSPSTSSGSFKYAGERSGFSGDSASDLFSLPNNAAIAFSGFSFNKMQCPQFPCGNDKLERFDYATGKFTTVASSMSSRYGHTAGILKDGNLYLAGGRSSLLSTLKNDIQIYNPNTGLFLSQNSLLSARAGHVSIVLNDGRILSAGGLTDANSSNPTTSAEIFNPFTGNRSYTGSMITARTGAEAILLSNGKVLVYGGVSSSVGSIAITSLEIFDPSTETFQSIGDLLGARKSYSATLLKDGSILVVGGYLNNVELTSAEILNMNTYTSKATGSASFFRMSGSAVLLNDGNVLFAGSNSVKNAEIYDTAKGVFSTIASMNQVRGAPLSTLLSNGFVLILNGSEKTSEVYSY